MSSVAQARKRNGRFIRRPDSHEKPSNSHNTRMQQFTNGIPHPSSKHREPKKLKTKRKYDNVRSKYSSVFSRYLKEPAYPPSINATKYSKVEPKNPQDRLVMRIFGNENNYKMIKSMMHKNSKEPNNASRPPLKHKQNMRDGYSPVYKEMKSMVAPNPDYSTHQVQNLDKTESEGNIRKEKDFDVRLEKALLDLSEHKNNFYKDKSEFDKQIEQSKATGNVGLRQTFYGSGPYPGSHQLINSSGNFKPVGYSTSTRFRPSTQENSDKRSMLAGEGLSDGNILSNIDCISNDELKERLVVAEMIMKKLYTRNKDLEVAIDKAVHKNKNFAKNAPAENTKNNKQVDNSKLNENESGAEDQDDEASEIEIGCKE